MDKAKRNI